MSTVKKVVNGAKELVDRMHPSGMLYATYEQRLIAELDRSRLPRHVAVMADGNRRWAKLNAPGESLVKGYEAGADKLLQFAGWCDEVGIPTITLWVLSTENLQRNDADELLPLLDVIEKLVTDLAASDKWRVKIVGDLTLLPEPMVHQLRAAEERTARINGMHINVAVPYGGRHELRDAIRSLLREEATKGTSLTELAERIDFDDIAEHLYTKGQPDPDLLIRTSGEQRLSNFFMW
ncbi:MAG: polyprenyl diphosphate synthase, partial [Propionibacteriaceae bacterium]